jgi:hypothetical protein
VTTNAQQSLALAVEANPHLASKAHRHEQLAAHLRKPDGRADLTPELWALIEAHGYSMTAQSRQWRMWLAQCMDSEDLDADAVGQLMVERNRQGRRAPTKDRLWSWGEPAKWRASVVRPTPRDSMSGGLVSIDPGPSRYIPLAEARAQRAAEEGAA